MRRPNEKAADLGHPSYVWRAGQQRRFEMIKHWVRVNDANMLVDGAGIGMYSRHLAATGARVTSLDIDHPSMTVAALHHSDCVVAACENLPFASSSFDTILSHEVLEHVTADDSALAEISRVLRPGGRLVLFVPNRLYPFETHGHYWRGKYYFGNTPLINYLPARMRNQLAPHVRAYTNKDITRSFAPLSMTLLCHIKIYPGYDNIIYRFARFGQFLRKMAYSLERTPLREFGISHFVVAESFEIDTAS